MDIDNKIDIDEICDLADNITLNKRIKDFNINEIDFEKYQPEELYQSIINYNVFRNTAYQKIVLLTKDVINSIYMLPCINKSTNTIYNFVLSKCAVLKTNDNVYIIYYPLNDNFDTMQTFNHLQIYQVGEVLYNLRLNNINDFMIQTMFTTIIVQVYEFVDQQIKLNKCITTTEYLNTTIKILNYEIPYGFILWLYFLMKLRKDFYIENKIDDLDEQIIENDVICIIFVKLYNYLPAISKEVNKWFL